jgi:hypothetical protein
VKHFILFSLFCAATIHAADQTFVSSVYVEPEKGNSFKPFEYEVLASKRERIWNVARQIAAKNNLTISDLYYYDADERKHSIHQENTYPFLLHKFRNRPLHIVAKQNKQKQNF